jgi:DnaJ like chaperone protein
VLQAHSPTVKEAMGWYGKLIGAALGAIIGRGLLGAIVGFVIGHLYDSRVAADRRQRPGPRPGGTVPPADLQAAFFRATFQVMGHVAKADGRVTEQEIDAARDAMRRFSLGEREMRRAIELYTEGKASDFPLEDSLATLRAGTAGREDLRRLRRARGHAPDAQLCGRPGCHGPAADRPPRGRLPGARRRCRGVRR